MPSSQTPQPPTPEWLTDALRQSGTLAAGRVERCEADPNAAFNSAAQHLRVIYSADAPAGLPGRLFLKRNLPEAWAVRAGKREVAFYQAAAALGDRLPMLPPCYGASYDPASGDSWLLLRDLSETHRPPVTREQLLAGAAVPPDEELTAIVRAVAGLHAAWWEHPSLGAGALPISEWYRDRDHFEMALGEFADNWITFQRTAGDVLPESVTDLYEETLSGLQFLWKHRLAGRIADRRNLTISHGDCYLSQFLCPLPGSPDASTYLIDFQGACGDLPAMDLVFLFATFWTPEQRRQQDCEQRLLRLYHAALGEHGVAGYSWDDLLMDYRISLAFMLFYPIWDAVNGSRQSYWEPKLCCLASAAEDWRITALFTDGGE